MTLEQTGELMALLKVAYPLYYKDISIDEAEQATSLWFDLLEEYDNNLATAALKALIASNKFPPTISEVLNKINFLTRPRELTELEAWSFVQKAIRNSTYHATEEFEKLPPLIQRIIRTPEQLKAWAIMDVDDVNKVISSNFQRSFRAGANYEKEYMALPENVKTMVDQLSDSFGDMPSLEEGK